MTMDFTWPSCGDREDSYQGIKTTCPEVIVAGCLYFLEKSICKCNKNQPMKKVNVIKSIECQLRNIIVAATF